MSVRLKSQTKNVIIFCRNLPSQVEESAVYHLNSLQGQERTLSAVPLVYRGQKTQEKTSLANVPNKMVNAKFSESQTGQVDQINVLSNYIGPIPVKQLANWTFVLKTAFKK